MMSHEERALLRQLVEKVNQLERRLGIQETIETDVSTYTDEAAQDAVGGILVDSTSIDFTYTDATPSITAVRAALTGDVTASANSNATTIANNAVTTAKILDANVTLAKLANIATDSLIGRDTASSGVPENITLGASLEMDGSLHLQRAALTGDVTASANSNTTAIGANKVLTAMIADAQLTLAKMANLAADTIIGRANGAGTGVPQALTATQVRTIINVASGADVTGTAITALATKTTPVDADAVVITDSAASDAPKRTTWANIKATLKTYFDTLYGLLATANTWTANNAFNSTATSGSALSVTRNLTATSTDSPVVSILQDHASDDQVALEVLQDGTGAGVTVRGPNAKSSATASTPLYLRSSDALASGLAMSIEINGNATAGSRYTSIHSIEQGTSFRPLVLNPSADVMAVILRAFSASGLTITDDGGNLGIFIEDGGRVGIGTTTPAASPETLSRLTVEGSDGTGIYAVIRNTGNGQAALSLTRTGTTPSRWVIYIPGANDLLSFYSGTLADAPLNLLSTGQMVAGSLTSVGATRLGIKAGTSTNDAAAGGVLYVSTGATGNVGTGEDDLLSYSVPANTLSANGMSLWFEASGSSAANANAKTLRARFTAGSGTTLLSSTTLSPSGTEWFIRGRIIRTGAATQKSYTSIMGINITAAADLVTTLDQTLSGAVTLKITGEAVSNNDIVCESFIVGWDDVNT